MFAYTYNILHSQYTYTAPDIICANISSHI